MTRPIRFAGIGIDHRHIFGMAANMMEAGAEFVGWWTDGETLVAFINVWPEGFHKRTGGYTAYRLSHDGETWSEPRPVLGADGMPVNGVIE